MYQNLQKHSPQLTLAHDHKQKPLKISDLQLHLVQDHHVPKPAKTFINF